MDMIWLDSQSKNAPSLLFALRLDKFLATLRKLPNQDRLSSLGTQDEMVDNEMDSVLISLIFKLARFCRFHSR